MQSTTTAVSAPETNIIIPVRKKAAYALGDFGNNFNWTFVSSFLMFFYTDVFGIAPAAVAMLVLVARIWDGVNDPVIGTLADRTRTRWGRFRPWTICAAPFCAALVILTYWAHPGWGGTAKIVYMYVTYGLLVLAYTCVNLPYGTLCSVMTQNIEERAKLSGLRMTFALIAIQLITAFTNPLVEKMGKGNMQRGFLCVAILYAGIFLTSHIVCFCNTKEVVPPPERQQQLPVWQQLKLISKNKPYLLTVLAQTIWGLTVYGRMASYMYYFTYVEGNAAYFTTYSLVSIVPSVLGAFTYQFWYKKIGNKGRTAAVAGFMVAILLTALTFFRIGVNPVAFCSILVFERYFDGMFSAAVYALVPDTAEYGEWKTGVRNDGFQYAFVSLGNKVGMAIGTAGIAAMLGMQGYVPNAVQSPQVIKVICAFFTVLPAIFWAITAVALCFYNINRESYKKMVEEIKRRKAAQAQ